MIHRDIRYQAALVKDHSVLLARMRMPDGRTFWMPPGGGREGDESPIEAVRREILEETNLEITVERLLFIELDIPGGVYDYLHTYLCHLVSGTPEVGVEPEAEFLPIPTIDQLAWFNLKDPASWLDHPEMDPPVHSWLDRLAGLL